MEIVFVYDISVETFSKKNEYKFWKI